jgi:hypothetical protein
MKDKMDKILYIAPQSTRAYGAEEQDLQSGRVILNKLENVDFYDIQISLKGRFIEYSFEADLENVVISITDILRYFLIRWSTLDRAMTQAYTFKNYLKILKIVKKLEIDIIITNTTSTVLFGIQQYAKHVFRSVSFEPVYVLKAVDSKFKAYIHAVLKLLSIHKEFRADIILAISPRDANYYRKMDLSRSHKILIMPLRQFYNYKSKHDKLTINKRLNVGFLGSTYNVLHNRKSFDFILKKIPSSFWLENRIKLNIYGRKIPPLVGGLPSIDICNWINDIDEVYKTNQCFLVPYFLSSGMQSKVFEPLLRGRVLICDPRVLSGYSFIPFQHYIPATTALDFVTALSWVNLNFYEASNIAYSARSQAEKLIGQELLMHQTKLFLNDAQQNKKR